MISAEWLTERLREGGYLPYFRVREIRVIDRHESDTSMRYTLRIRYGDVSVARKLPGQYMVLKVYNAGYPQADKEVTFYNQILPSLRAAYGDEDLSLINGYDAHYDVETDQSHVLMAGLPAGFKQHFEPVPPTKRHYTQLADALAKIHACFWADERLGNTIGLALTEARLDDMLARQRSAWEQFQADGMIVLDPSQRAALDRVAGRMPADVPRAPAGRRERDPDS